MTAPGTRTPRTTVLRGEIRDFPDRSTRGVVRPMLVVQANALNGAAPTVVGLVVTTRPQRAGAPLAVALGPDDGVVAPAWVKVTQVHTVAAAGAGDRLATLSPERMAEVDAALAEVLGLSGARGRAV